MRFQSYSKYKEMPVFLGAPLLDIYNRAQCLYVTQECTTFPGTASPGEAATEFRGVGQECEQKRLAQSISPGSHKPSTLGVARKVQHSERSARLLAARSGIEERVRSHGC